MLLLTVGGMAAVGTLSIHLGLDRAHIATLRGTLEDLIGLKFLDAEAEERLITLGLHRVYVGQGKGSPGRHQLSVWLAVQDLPRLQLNCLMRH